MFNLWYFVLKNFDFLYIYKLGIISSNMAKASLLNKKRKMNIYSIYKIVTAQILDILKIIFIFSVIYRWKNETKLITIFSIDNQIEDLWRKTRGDWIMGLGKAMY